MSGQESLVDFVEKITAWCERSAKRSAEQVKQNRGRFESLADACEADRKNYAAMAEHGRKALRKLATEKLR